MSNNNKELIQHFESGVKDPARKCLGTELERIPYLRDGLKPLPFSGEVSIESLFQQLIQDKGWKASAQENGKVIALERSGSQVTLEPGGQVELGTSQHKSPLDAVEEVDAFRNELEAVSNDKIVWLNCGLNPLYAPDEVNWVPKARYAIMRPHMQRSGKLGTYMMALTAAVQTSIDYHGEEDCADKLALATRLTPIFVAMYANSPFCAGRATGYMSFRNHIWQDTDPARCGIPKFFLERRDIFNAYTEHALDVPMLFIERGGQLKEVGGITFREHLDSVNSDDEQATDWQLHLSTLFLETRLKTFIEIRSADLTPQPLAMTFPTLCFALFYHAEAKAEAAKVVADHDYATVMEAILSAQKHGLGSSRYGNTPILDLAREVVQIAQQALKSMFPEQADLLTSLQQRVQQGKSLAELLVAEWEGGWSQDVAQLKEFISKDGLRNWMP